jgi:ribosomal protein L12E/L44/L45/RPP1/RPP2
MEVEEVGVNGGEAEKQIKEGKVEEKEDEEEEEEEEEAEQEVKEEERGGGTEGSFLAL